MILESLSKQANVSSPPMPQPQPQPSRQTSNPVSQPNNTLRSSRSRGSVAKPVPVPNRRRNVSSHKHQAQGDASLWPADEETEQLLKLYETKMDSAFPFVSLPDQSIASMRQDRPYLLKSFIMAASYKDRVLQKQRTDDFMASITNSIVLDSNRDLDILQALLLHIAWQVNASIYSLALSN